MANEMFDPTEPEPEQPEEQEEEPEREEEDPEQEEQPEPEPEEEPGQEEEAPEEEEGEDPEEQHEEEQPGEEEQEHEEGLEGEDPQEEGSTEDGETEAQPKVIHNGSDNLLDTERLLAVLQEITVPKGDPSFKALLKFVPQGSNDIIVAPVVNGQVTGHVTSQYVSVVGIGDNPISDSAAPIPPFVDPTFELDLQDANARIEAERVAAVRKKVKIALASFLGLAVVGTVVGLSVGLTRQKEEEGAFDVSGKTVDPIDRDFKGDVDVIGGDTKLAGRTIASLKLLDSSGPGTFSVGMGNVIHFETSAFVKDATVTQAAVGYRLTDSNGKVSKDGTLTLKFNNKPVAFNLTSPPAPIPFDVVAAAFAPQGVASVALTGVPGEGTWSVDSATNKIQFKSPTAPTGPQSSAQYNFTDKANVTSNTATVTAPTATAVTPITPFPLDGISLTIPRKFDADIDLSKDPKLAGKTIAEVFLPTAVNGKVTIDKVGDFSVNGKSIHFKTANVVKTAADAKATYYLKDASGATSAQAELSLTFDNTTPVAADVTSEVKGRTAADFVQVDVVAASYLPPSFVWKAVELIGGPPLSSGGYKVDKLGSWLVVGKKIQFEPDPTSTKPFADTRYRLVAQDGSVTAEGTLTVNFPMVVAPNMMLAKRGLNQAKANVFSRARSQNPLNGDSVTLVSPVDFGYQPGTQGGILAEDGKRLHVPGEGVWKVENDGGVSFQADKQLAQPGAPSPVIYCFADTLGNVSNFAVLAFDPLNERQAAFDSLAAKTDAQFWTDLENDTLKTPSAALDNQELLTVLAAMGAITMRMIPLAAPNPIAPAALDAACTAWSKQGKTHAQLFEIARQTFDALPGTITVPFAVRYWRLRLMFQMLKREVDAAAAAVKQGGKH